MLAASLVVLPHVPLVPLLVSTQALNAVLLVPLLVVLHLLSRDRETMGEHVVGPAVARAQLAVLVMVVACVALVLGLAL
ncbi:MAG TPA: hypothetical protein VFP51_06480 [Nocardioidaceae bacterium]|nr:hypothetical protein [Nocardioidaceae bacterium]